WRWRFLLGRFAPLRWTLPLLGDRRWRRRVPLGRRGFTLLHRLRLHWRRGGGPVFRQRRRRHLLGMTMGELAKMFNGENNVGAKLTVIPMQDWSHGDWFDSTGLAWVNPSPNIRSLNAAILYPGT